MPWRLITTRSYFTFWTILRTDRSSQQRLQQRQRVADGDLVLGQAAAQQIALAGLVRRAAHRRRVRAAWPAKADESRPASGRARWSRCRERNDAGLARLRDPVGERRHVADADIGGERRTCAADRSFRARRRKQRGRLLRPLARVACAGPRSDAGACLRLLAASATAAVMPAPTSGPCASRRARPPPRGSICATIGAGRLGDAAGQRGELHRLQEADQLRAVRRLQHEIVQRRRPPARRSSAAPVRARCAPCRHCR